jgi:hypothetical protein
MGIPNSIPSRTTTNVTGTTGAGGVSTRPRRAHRTKQKTIHERVIIADEYFQRAPPYRLLPKLRCEMTNERVKREIPDDVNFTLFMKIEESDVVNETKEVLIRRCLDGYIISGVRAKDVLDLSESHSALVNTKDYPPAWEIYVSTKSKSRNHDAGAQLLARFLTPVKKHARKRAKGCGTNLYSANQGKARAIKTWRDELLICSSFESISVFDMQSCHLLWVLQSSQFRAATGYGMDVWADELYIPVIRVLPDDALADDASQSPTNDATESVGVLVLSLPSLQVVQTLWCSPEVTVCSCVCAPQKSMCKCTLFFLGLVWCMFC